MVLRKTTGMKSQSCLHEDLWRNVNAEVKTDGMTASMPANTSGYIADRYTDTQAHTQASRATSLASIPLSLGACFCRFLFGWTVFIVRWLSDPILMRPEWVMSLARLWSGSQNSWTDTVPADTSSLPSLPSSFSIIILKHHLVKKRKKTKQNVMKPHRHLIQQIV